MTFRAKSPFTINTTRVCALRSSTCTAELQQGKPNVHSIHVPFTNKCSTTCICLY